MRETRQETDRERRLMVEESSRPADREARQRTAGEARRQISGPARLRTPGEESRRSAVEASVDFSDEARRQIEKKARRILALVLVGFMAGMLRAWVSFGTVSRFEGGSGTWVKVSGVFLRAEEKDEETVSAEVLLFPERKAEKGRVGESAASELSGARVPGGSERILVTISHCPLKVYELPGREAVIAGAVKEPASAANPGAFDYALYLRSRKILFTMKTGGDQILWTGHRGGVWSVLRWIGRRKEEYRKVLEHYLGAEEADILRGILFGEDQYMDEEVRESFGENGIGHLLAASGLHAGFVYALMFALCRRPLTFTGHLPVLAVLAVYSALADFSPSVVRAVLMITVSVIGRIRFLRTDFLTNIAFCAGILLLYEPAELFSSGFQLSFTAVISLAVLLPVMERLAGASASGDAGAACEDGGAAACGDAGAAAWGNAEEGAGEESGNDTEEEGGLADQLYRRSFTALTGMAALQAGMIPVTLKHYHYISVAGLALNMPAIALAGWIVPAGVVLMPVSLLAEQGFLPFLEPALAVSFYLMRIPLRLLLWMNEQAAAGGRSCVYMPSPCAAVFLMYYGALFLLCTESGSRFRKFCLKGKRKPAFAAAVASLLFFSCGLGSLADGVSREADLIYVDVGQGNCAHLRAGGKDILFDSGGSEFKDVGKDILMPYFLGSGVGDIDLAVLSHLHTDHYKGLCSLKEYVPVRNLALSAAYRSVAEQIEEETGVPREHMLFLEQGDHFVYGEAEFTVLAPKHRSERDFAKIVQDEKEENNLSLIIRADYKGMSVLFTGDISSELEMELIGTCREELRSDILTVAHHGSRFSSCTPFLDAVSPSLCVIQVGANNIYGHPAQETLDRIEAEGFRICRCDRQGAVMLRFCRGIRIRTMK